MFSTLFTYGGWRHYVHEINTAILMWVAPSWLILVFYAVQVYILEIKFNKKFYCCDLQPNLEASEMNL